MESLPDQAAGPARRSRFEIRTIFLIALAVIVGGAAWVAVKGSPTHDRAAIDSSANPTPTINPQPRHTTAAPH